MSSASRAVLGLLGITLLVTPCSAADNDQPPELTPPLMERDLSGPRLGFTFRPEDDDSTSNVGRLVSQFGWHFETQIVPRGGGPQFIIEFIPLFAGVEYGKFAPSLSLGMGVRFPAGYEFGIGPTAAVSQSNGEYKTKSALLIAVGKSFDYGGVSIPLNLVFATNKDGTRLSIITGYAIRRASKDLGG
jgi:hypothetical protein